jgi:hypothetical protein
MSQQTLRPRGRLSLTVRAGGRVVARRQARNMVLRQGAAIVAGLFAGSPGGLPINRVKVGFAKDGGTPELTALTPPPPPLTAPPETLSAPLGADAFHVVADQPDSVRVSITALFKPTVDLPGVSEAGLLAGDRLYNQVVFEPIHLQIGQDVTFFWEVDFPFGR